MTEHLQSNWHNITINDPQVLKNANNQLHQASQFLAIIGKNLLPQKSDDSNTNIGIIANGIIGRKVDGSKPFHGFIDIPGFNLNLVDPGMNRIWSTEIAGKSRDEVLDELKNAINDQGFDGSSFKHIDHYKIEIPHPIESGAVFEKPDPDALRTWLTLYSNSWIILSQASRKFKNPDEIRIWPHHFDIGTYNALNDEGTKAIGMGLAIPDSMIDEFYFYIYGWQKDKKIDLTLFNPLSVGSWKRGDWNGAVLPVSQLGSGAESNQKDQTLQFFNESIDQYLHVLK